MIHFIQLFFETSLETNFYHTLDSYCETWILQTSFNSHPPFSPHISITMSRMWFIVFTNNLSSRDLGSVINLFIPKNRLDVIHWKVFLKNVKQRFYRQLLSAYFFYFLELFTLSAYLCQVTPVVIVLEISNVESHVEEHDNERS